MTVDAQAYGVTVRRGTFEGERLFEARVCEFPDLFAYGESHDEAYDLMIDAIDTTAAAFEERGQALPPPRDVPEDFSGRVTLRLPKSLHREIAAAAEDEGVSLNQHLVNVLSYFSGFCNAPAPAGSRAGAWTPVPARQPSQSGARLRVVESYEVQDCA